MSSLPDLRADQSVRPWDVLVGSWAPLHHSSYLLASKVTLSQAPGPEALEEAFLGIPSWPSGLLTLATPFRRVWSMNRAEMALNGQLQQRPPP